MKKCLISGQTPVSITVGKARNVPAVSRDRALKRAGFHLYRQKTDTSLEVFYAVPGSVNLMTRYLITPLHRKISCGEVFKSIISLRYAQKPRNNSVD